MNEQKKYLRVIEAVVGCSVKKVFLKISHNIQEITCARVSFFSHVFSCVFYEICKNTFLSEHQGSAAWKLSSYRVFSGPYFPVFGPEETPYLDTFHVVQ